MWHAAKRRAKSAGNPGKPGKKLRLEDLQSQFGVGLKEAANRLGICPTTLKVDTLAASYLLLSFPVTFPCGLTSMSCHRYTGTIHVPMLHWAPAIALASMTAVPPLSFHGFCQDSPSHKTITVPLVRRGRAGAMAFSAGRAASC